mmetsp:Transcript_22831/g.63484  ORF Transcript_22831/g.63484 Transcript_22831/m.63484 type:complete len:202 (+) Transcript_22831:380-985(+)
MLQFILFRRRCRVIPVPTFQMPQHREGKGTLAPLGRVIRAAQPQAKRQRPAGRLTRAFLGAQFAAALPPKGAFQIANQGVFHVACAGRIQAGGKYDGLFFSDGHEIKGGVWQPSGRRSRCRLLGSRGRRRQWEPYLAVGPSAVSFVPNNVTCDIVLVVAVGQQNFVIDVRARHGVVFVNLNGWFRSAKFPIFSDPKAGVSL